MKKIISILVCSSLLMITPLFAEDMPLNKSKKSPLIAGILSATWPGTGLIYTGETKRSLYYFGIMIAGGLLGNMLGTDSYLRSNSFLPFFVPLMITSTKDSVISAKKKNSDYNEKGPCKNAVSIVFPVNIDYHHIELPWGVSYEYTRDNKIGLGFTLLYTYGIGKLESWGKGSYGKYLLIDFDFNYYIKQTKLRPFLNLNVNYNLYGSSQLEGSLGLGCGFGIKYFLYDSYSVDIVLFRKPSIHIPAEAFIPPIDYDFRYTSILQIGSTFRF